MHGSMACAALQHARPMLPYGIYFLYGDVVLFVAITSQLESVGCVHRERKQQHNATA